MIRVARQPKKKEAARTKSLIIRDEMKGLVWIENIKLYPKENETRQETKRRDNNDTEDEKKRGTSTHYSPGDFNPYCVEQSTIASQGARPPPPSAFPRSRQTTRRTSRDLKPCSFHFCVCASKLVSIDPIGAIEAPHSYSSIVVEKNKNKKRVVVKKTHGSWNDATSNPRFTVEQISSKSGVHKGREQHTGREIYKQEGQDGNREEREENCSSKRGTI